MDNKKPKKIKKTKKVKVSFLEKNIKNIAIVLLLLLVFQSMRGCVSNSSHTKEINTLTHINDSLNSIKDQELIEVDSILSQKIDFIQYLEYELKIAGVKVQAADDRAKAVQSTAEKVKNNTTTTIKIQADTTQNKIVNQDTIQ
jgi:hypothetical protein